MAKLIVADITVTMEGTKANWAWRGVSMAGVSAGDAARLVAAAGADKPSHEGRIIPVTGQSGRARGVRRRENSMNAGQPKSAQNGGGAGHSPKFGKLDRHRRF